MKNTTVLKLSFVLIICICILILINSRTSIFGTIGNQYSPSPTPSDVESITQNTNRIVAQLNSYDNITKELKMTLYYVTKTDCSRVKDSECVETSVDGRSGENKSMKITNDIVFKMNTEVDQDCLYGYNYTTKRTGNIEELIKSKCKYIGAISFFEVTYKDGQIIEFDELFYRTPGLY
jgi:hypothetical protein